MCIVRALRSIMTMHRHTTSSNEELKHAARIPDLLPSICLLVCVYCMCVPLSCEQQGVNPYGQAPQQYPPTFATPPFNGYGR
jgi:hypothetical protein